jgi:acyl-CoA reductase-like NAD-dependent aldehyde dehydrogenase
LTCLEVLVVEARVLTISDPADGSQVGQFDLATTVDAQIAVETAAKAFSGWARTSATDRAARVHAAADRVAAAADDLALWTQREMGKPRSEALAGVRAGVSGLRQSAELGPVHRGRSLHGAWDATDLMVPEPRGVIAAITPWNDPVAIPCGLIGAALVTGNSVVFKPSERTPGTGVELAHLLAAELPHGVLELVVGDGVAGATLATSPDVDLVCHVGSSATGRSISQAAARSGTKVLLENGGNDPMIVDEGLDVQWAAEQAALGAFANSGQLCTSVERIFVVETVAEAFLTALASRAERLSAGLAPLVDNRMRDVVHGQVIEAVEKGATVLSGGEMPDGPGSFYPATVLSACTGEMTVMREETFGPVAPVSVVPSFEAALDAARVGPFGLAAVVLTGSMKHAQQAWRELPVGTVKVNAAFGGAPGGAAQPRGISGMGFGYGPELLDEMTVTKVIHLGIPQLS